MKINFYQTLKELSVACEFFLNCVNLVLGLEYLILNPWNPLRKNWFIFMAFERLSVYWKICKWQNRKISDVRPRARAHSPKIDTMTHIVKMKEKREKMNQMHQDFFLHWNDPAETENNLIIWFYHPKFTFLKLRISILTSL